MLELSRSVHMNVRSAQILPAQIYFLSGSEGIRKTCEICSCNQTAMKGRLSIRQPDNIATGAKEALLFLSLRLKYAVLNLLAVAGGFFVSHCSLLIVRFDAHFLAKSR